MRWKSELTPRHGEERVIKCFLLFPTEIDNEWRWWETAYIKQEFIFLWGGDTMWRNLAWSTQEDYIRYEAFRITRETQWKNSLSTTTTSSPAARDS